MNPYQFSCSCDVCGGPGAATIKVMSGLWLGRGARHRDPAVCASYLEEKRRSLEAREKALNLTTTVAT